MRYVMYATLIAGVALPGVAQGQVVIDDHLTGASSSYDWRALNGACLTAGNNTGSERWAPERSSSGQDMYLIFSPHPNSPTRRPSYLRSRSARAARSSFAVHN